MTLQLKRQRSLTPKQINDAFEKFESCSKLLRLEKSKQISKKSEKGFISYTFAKKSESYRISTPQISISRKNYCKNLENVNTVEISIHNCATCRGTDSAEIISRKYFQLETILTDAFEIFYKSYKENLLADSLLVEDQKNLKKLKKIFKYGSKKVQDGRWQNTEYYLGKRKGTVYRDDDAETNSKFKIVLENISFTDMTRLSVILGNFLKEEPKI